MALETNFHYDLSRVTCLTVMQNDLKSMWSFLICDCMVKKDQTFLNFTRLVINSNGLLMRDILHQRKSWRKSYEVNSCWLIGWTGGWSFSFLSLFLFIYFFVCLCVCLFFVYMFFICLSICFSLLIYLSIDHFPYLGFQND